MFRGVPSCRGLLNRLYRICDQLRAHFQLQGPHGGVVADGFFGLAARAAELLLLERRGGLQRAAVLVDQQDDDAVIAAAGTLAAGEAGDDHYAHRLVEQQARVRKARRSPLPWLRPDAKSQVTLRYRDGVISGLEAVVLSTQHDTGVSQRAIREGVMEHILRPVLPRQWLDQLPAGLDTPVGERGGRLSAGERQLVALVRAWIADPALLVLDEATSAVDPALEVRLRRAIERLTGGRTSITVAHRLSTAEAADEVLVFDRGRLVERGRHDALLAQGGAYAALHADWAAGTSNP